MEKYLYFHCINKHDNLLIKTKRINVFQEVLGNTLFI